MGEIEGQFKTPKDVERAVKEGEAHLADVAAAEAAKANTQQAEKVVPMGPEEVKTAMDSVGFVLEGGVKASPEDERFQGLVLDFNATLGQATPAWDNLVANVNAIRARDGRVGRVIAQGR